MGNLRGSGSDHLTTMILTTKTLVMESPACSKGMKSSMVPNGYCQIIMVVMEIILVERMIWAIPQLFYSLLTALFPGQWCSYTWPVPS